MPSLDTTELKLKSTPTGGVEAAHSPYYRRLLSAGYKGFLQGTIGGGALYGSLGLIIGGLAAIPLATIPVVAATLGATSPFWLAPIAAAVGIWKGATTFGQIGSVAAITAESSDLAEQRRYLLDYYYELPDTPDGNRQAEVIKQELLNRAGDVEVPDFYHWKSGLIGAAIGTALAVGVVLIPGVLPVLGLSLHGLQLTVAAAGAASLGALAGATIGIDRYYIRKWFDSAQNVVHSSSHKENALMERHLQLQRIRAAAQEDEKTKTEMQGNSATSTSARDSQNQQDAPANSKTPAASETPPSTTVSEARLKGIADIRRAMEVPVI
jgi:hypothetical protein